MTAFSLAEARTFLSQTPRTLRVMVGELPGPWLASNEGDDTWSAHDVVAHLTDLEDTDWLVRARMILTEGTTAAFPPIDRARFRASLAGAPLPLLLSLFAERRERNLRDLELLDAGAHLAVRGRHPEFGEVTLEQLLATWVVHDLTHIVQISRVMARRYADDVGPWRKYLSVLGAPGESP